MASRKIYRVALAAVLIVAGWGASSRAALAQEAAERPQAQPRVRSDEAAGLEVQLHLLVARPTADGQDEKLPAALDAVVKQLRATFPFKSYRLATTLLNRVKNGGNLTVRWIGSPLIAQSAATTATPGFNEFNIFMIHLEKDDEGHNVVNMGGFNFGARIPIQLPSVASTGASVPTIQYEQTGIRGDVSVREGEPTIVGTLNVGPSGDAIIVVVTAKRPVK